MRIDHHSELIAGSITQFCRKFRDYGKCPAGGGYGLPSGINFRCCKLVPTICKSAEMNPVSGCTARHGSAKKIPESVTNHVFRGRFEPDPIRNRFCRTENRKFRTAFKINSIFTQSDIAQQQFTGTSCREI